MEENAIKVLKSQIEKLDARKFDLNAWKESTIILLDRIFGPLNERSDAIRKIKYDQGSWVLRDETGSTNSLVACKNLGKEVLESAILELENFGMPDMSDQSIQLDVIIRALEDELTGSQFREIKKSLQEKGSIEDKKKVIMTKLKAFGRDTAFAIIAGILTDKQVISKIR